ncbi:MAG: TrkH family potassium uptake protein [Candidatus Omnitrophica bacterium]|nr:TrkH family potassium uptake protein [Candidatus Omnitrophota bacterium]
MNRKFILFSLGKLLVVLSFLLLVPAVIAYFEIAAGSLTDSLFDARLAGFVIAILSSLLCGIVCRVFGSGKLAGTGIREGFAIVTFGWFSLTLFGCIPLLYYFLSRSGIMTPAAVVESFTNAYFEIMSGFTTTGATILTDIEAMPRGILFWRSLTHWLGGMGIITLALAILPAFGIASYQMFRGEIPGPATERLKPRLAQTAKILWGTYALLTLLEAVLLKAGGMTFFDAFCHSFGTMATGGFSTRNASIGSYNSAFIEWVVIIFMFFAGMNFVIHYRIIFSRKFDLLRRNGEFRFYAFIIVVAVILTTAVLYTRGIAPADDVSRSYRNQPLSADVLGEKMIVEQGKVDSFLSALRHCAFQVVSITTTTGYCTADFDVWPNFIRYMLVILMFFGGCAGSTGGGMKMVRIMVIIKDAWREIKTTIQPRIIAPIKIDGRAIDEKQVANIGGFVALFAAFFVVFSLIMSFLIRDFTTAITTVAATMCNIGPGLSGIGAAENYAWIPLSGKWVLVLCMLLGRLEIYTVLIALSSWSWRK